MAVMVVQNDAWIKQNGQLLPRKPVHCL